MTAGQQVAGAVSDGPRRPGTDLAEINHAIAKAETHADRAFFEKLLAPVFSMVRPDGVRIDDRDRFLAALAASPPRVTRMESTIVFDNRAVVVCSVAKLADSGPVWHRNIRVFSRSNGGTGWQLVSWLTEPLAGLDDLDPQGEHTVSGQPC